MSNKNGQLNFIVFILVDFILKTFLNFIGILLIPKDYIFLDYTFSTVFIIIYVTLTALISILTDILIGILISINLIS
jgi:hypothetical protein